MVDRTPSQIRSSIVDANITSDSVAANPSSTSPPGIADTGWAPQPSTSHYETRPSDALKGVRGTPNDQGALYSDTPSATVFVCKKQWMSDTWTFVVNDKTTASQVSEENGRRWETQKRDIYERILTRKLQMLSDYESMTKIRNQLSLAVELNRIPEDVKKSLSDKVNAQDPNALTDQDLELLYDLEAVPTGFGNNNTTRYYTTPSSVAPGKAKEYSIHLGYLRQLDSLAGPDDMADLSSMIQDQEEKIKEIDRKILDLNNQLQKIAGSIGSVKSQLNSGIVFVNDSTLQTKVKVNLETYLQQLIIKQNYLLTILEQEKQIKQSAANILAEYKKRKTIKKGSIADLREYVATLKQEAENERSKYGRLVPLDSFNGIIEFMNVTSISTSVQINGQGQASISFENPFNLLRISREDIYLALSEQNIAPDTVEDFSELSIGWTDSTSISSSTTADLASRAGLYYYYKGAYRTKAELDVILTNQGVIDATTGVSTGEKPSIRIHYLNIQNGIYKELQIALKKRAIGSPINVSNFQLPTSQAVITSQWLTSNKEDVTNLLKGDSKTSVAASTIVNSYLTTLKDLEKILGITSKSTIENSNNPSTVETKPQDEKSNARINVQALKNCLSFLNTKKSSVAMRFIRELQQHFQGKWVVEVGDRVWIWMSSPSRTTQILEGQFPFVESVVGKTAQEFQSQANIAHLRNRIGELTNQINEKESILQGDYITYNNAVSEDAAEKAQLEITKKQLTAQQEYVAATQKVLDLEPKTSPDRINIFKRLTKGQDNLATITDNYQSLNRSYQVNTIQRNRQISVLESQIQALSIQIDSLKKDLSETQNDLNKSIGDSQSSKQSSGNQSSISQNTSSQGQQDPPKEKKSPLIPSAQDVGTSSDADPLSVVQYSTYGGFAEKEFQVFEGVVTGITGSYEGGIYTLNATVKDLTFYLEISRIMEKPSQRDKDIIGLLNDPIYRTIDRYSKCKGSTQPLTDEIKSEDGYPLAGHWKSGVYVTTAQLRSDLNDILTIARADLSDVGKTSTEVNCLHGLTPYNKLYSGLDSANLISLLVTGVPFDFSIYVANLAQIGYAAQEFNIQGDGSSEYAVTNPFTILREMIQVQNDFLGNFRPFLELTRDYSEESLKRFADDVNSSILIFSSTLNKRAGNNTNLYVTGSLIEAFIDAAGIGASQATSDLDPRKDGTTRVDIASLQNTLDPLTAAQKDPIYKEIRLLIARTTPLAVSEAGSNAAAVADALANKSLQLTSEEAASFGNLVRANTVYQSYRKEYREFITALSIPIGRNLNTNTVQPDASKAVIKEALARRNNAAAIVPTKRKIIERRKSNFLLISDEYTSNTNLAPYQLSISNSNTSEIWRSTFQTPYRVCKEAAELVDFEFYADEYGHLRFKPPTYNRIFKEHLTLTSFSPSFLVRLKDIFPGLDSVQKYSTLLKIQTQIIQNQKTFAQLLNSSSVSSSSFTPLGPDKLSADKMNIDSLIGPSGSLTPTSPITQYFNLNNFYQRYLLDVHDTLSKIQSDILNEEREVDIANQKMITQKALYSASLDKKIKPELQVQRDPLPQNVSEGEELVEAFLAINPNMPPYNYYSGQVYEEYKTERRSYNTNGTQTGWTPPDFLGWTKLPEEKKSQLLYWASDGGYFFDNGQQSSVKTDAPSPTSRFEPSINVVYPANSLLGGDYQQSIINSVSKKIEEDPKNAWLKNITDAETKQKEILKQITVSSILTEMLLKESKLTVPPESGNFDQQEAYQLAKAHLSYVFAYLGGPGRPFEATTAGSGAWGGQIAHMRLKALEAALKPQIDAQVSSITETVQAENLIRLKKQLTKVWEIVTKNHQDWERFLNDPKFDSNKFTLLDSLNKESQSSIKDVPYFADELHIHRISSYLIEAESFTEHQPDYTRLDVGGKLPFSTVDSLAGEMYIWAGGVDYDLWRDYGYSEQRIDRAFIHSEGVAKQYCQALLSRQKSRTLSGSVTVRGDSKYKVGDCVFLEDSFLYFYIVGISHSFSYGSNYTTTLTLEYARRPDEFISNPFDTIGRIYAEIHSDFAGSNTVAQSYGLAPEFNSIQKQIDAESARSQVESATRTSLESQ